MKNLEEEVYKFAEEVEIFLEILNRTTIQSKYKNELDDIER
ncbi:hypothetical protein ACFO6R_15955 [Eubacterium multiforme]|uniref:Uncharacterized protein n=1 Tax=Eubacterium multiforme TaxID=83339 RepID=A0ABT9UTK4_9FIRM|nr:hypothetical protein [Eubacterium multiforme]MDQ0149644.1 hypothetical protein [Eubacterium multiforme]